MLIMPAPPGVPAAIWDKAEKAEMIDVTPLYGKTYHLWQVDRGDPVPMGPPQLMASFLSDEMVGMAHPDGIGGLLADRDQAFGVSFVEKRAQRREIPKIERVTGLLPFLFFSFLTLPSFHLLTFVGVRC